MALRETITVSITPELRSFIKGQLATGHYGSASEVVRAGLRRLIEDAVTKGTPAPDRNAILVSDLA